MRISTASFGLFLAAGILIAGCNTGDREPQKVTFTDVTDASGIDFRYNYGDTTYQNIMESSGSGVTVIDYDGDGDLDLYLLNGTYLEGISTPDGRVFKDTPDQFYRNDGNGRFTDVTEQAGLTDLLWSMAAAPIDYDADGDQDLYLLNYGPNRFFRNEGNGRFTDITARTGLAGPDSLNGFPKWSIGAVHWDYDRDGLIDIMVGNFMAFDPAIVADAGPQFMPHPAQYHGQASMLYRQLPGGRFVDVTREARLFYPESKAMGLVVFDYDDDGILDLFQANDHHFNYMFRADGSGRFSEVGTPIGVAANDAGKGTGSMHGTIGDVDGDGLVDLLVVDLEHGALYRNRGKGVFEDMTARSGLSQAFAGIGAWASAFLDYDNDGDLDLFSANGGADVFILQPPLLLENDGKGHFSNTGTQHGAYFGQKRSGRGGAVWDYDDDGDLDIVVSHVEQPGKIALLRNDGGNSRHWIGFSLVGKQGSASAVGARVTINAGGRTQVRINQPATSYLSNNDPRVHFGLDTARRVDRVEIRWPDGEVQVLTGLKADRYLTIVQGKGVVKK